MKLEKLVAIVVGASLSNAIAFGFDASQQQKVQTAFENSDQFLSEGAVLEAIEQGRALDQLAACLGMSPQNLGEMVDVFDPHYWVEQDGFEWQPISSAAFQGYVLFQTVEVEISQFDATGRAETCPVKVSPLVVDRDGSIVDKRELDQDVVTTVNVQAMFSL